MARPVRLEIAGAAYLVGARCPPEGGAVAFVDETDHAEMRQVLAQALARFDAQVLAYAFLATVTIHLGCGKPSLSQFWSVMTELGGQCDGHSLPVVWPSDAALLAILLHRPRAKLSLVLSAGLAGNLLANLITREAFLVPALLAPANLLGVAIAGTMLRRKLGTLSLLATPSTGGYFMTVAGILAPAASAIVGATVARWGFGHPFGTGLLIWFLAESLGLLLFTPVLLAMMRGEFRAWLHEPSEGGRVEMLAMQLLVLAAVTGGAFAAMVLAHWYLVTPKLPEAPLLLLSRALGAGIVVQIALFVLWQIAGLGGLGSGWDFFAILRLTIGLVFPALLTYAGWRTAQSRSMESATGLLYIDLGAVATGTILAAGLFFGAGILV